MKSLLQPVQWIYRTGVVLRNVLYDRGVITVYYPDIPVISVGNLNVGGSGKTPLVRQLAQALIARGQTVGVLSRGYKRSSKGQVIVSEGAGPVCSLAAAGDEPYMLSRALPEIVCIVDKDRPAAALLAEQQYGVDCLLLDDGFQHRALYRDMDIVLIPADEIRKREQVLPIGRLREPWRNLKRATDVIIVHQNSPEPAETSLGEFVKRWTDAAIHYAGKRTVPVLYSFPGDEVLQLGVDGASPAQIFVVCGIGNPAHFQQALEQLPVEIVEFRAFRDHYEFPLEAQRQILTAFVSSEADYLVMTGKDIVKWDQELVEMHRVCYMESDLVFSDDFIGDVVGFVG